MKWYWWLLSVLALVPVILGAMKFYCWKCAAPARHLHKVAKAAAKGKWDSTFYPKCAIAARKGLYSVLVEVPIEERRMVRLVASDGGFEVPEGRDNPMVISWMVPQW